VDPAEDLTVLIGTFGQLENLRPCLESIFESARGGAVSVRVILGFNFEGESQNPVTIRREFPQVEQWRAPKKLGVCRTYNQLMSRIAGRYALLLDDDTILRPHTLDTMVRFMDAHQDVGIAGCRTVNVDGSYQKSTGLMFSMRTEMLIALRTGALWRDGVDERANTWQTVDWLNGAFLLRTEVIDQVGGFDEYFHILVHEPDWCLRIRRAGWKVAYVPDAEVIHIGNTLSVVRSDKSYEILVRYHVNRYYFCRKHYGNTAVQGLRPIMTFGAFLRFCKHGAVWLLSPGRRSEAGPKVEAYWKVMLLGAAGRPDNLPKDLWRQNDISGALQPSFPE
jgi:GT2 family glycosyltransferase